MTIPSGNLRIVRGIRTFIVENLPHRPSLPAGRWDREFPIDACTFHELNGHTATADISSGFLDALRRGEPVGMMSEAGCPAVADPGAAVVEIAQRERLKVVPSQALQAFCCRLWPPDSTARGFAFNGYLPVKEDEKGKVIKELEARALTARPDTQIFIETPLSQQPYAKVPRHTSASGHALCVACDISSSSSESIVTMPAAGWRECKTWIMISGPPYF